jgi:addiction module RelE/StbE family toxin
VGWRVELTAASEAELRENFQKGIESTQLNRTWRDHELMGKWKGHRSMTFSFKGRLIYRIEHDVVVVRVVRITSDHNYR